MRGKTRLFGKTFPAWIVAAGLIVATSGAATGVVLAGRVTKRVMIMERGKLAGASSSRGKHEGDSRR